MKDVEGIEDYSIKGISLFLKLKAQPIEKYVYKCNERKFP